MLNKIAKFFNDLHQDALTEPDELTIEMACTVLLCEVMRADGLLDANEQAMLSKTIAEQFSLNSQEVNQLIAQAIELSEHAVDFHRFTSTLNQHYSAAEKTKLVTLLWQLALADGKVASIEEHTIRKIADLLHLSHAEYIQAKNTLLSNS